MFHDADSAAHDRLFGTDPLGIEVRMTIWGYDQPGAYGDIMFLNFQIFNKGNNFIEDAFVALWHDSDLGTATDDLLGTDTLLQMQYVYNDGADNVYGAAPPAIGYKLLRGPAVPSLGDSAIAFGKLLSDHTNAGMYASSKFVNSGFPETSDPVTASEAYYFMQGLNRLGLTKIDNLGNTTRYDYTGDPVTGEGWILTGAGDLRGMISFGPLDMAPGDSVELIAAVIIARDTSALHSLAKLREVSRNVQEIFDNDFQLHDFSLLSPLGGERLTGTVSIFWNASDKEGDILNLELYAISILGEKLFIDENLPNTGNYLWNTESMTDGFYLLQASVFDSSLGDFAFRQSAYSDSFFVIDNDANGIPFIRLITPFDSIVSGLKEITWNAVDIEDSTLLITLDYSVDEGEHWMTVENSIPNSGSYLWDSNDSPNSDSGMVMLTASDGDDSFSAVSIMFKLRNERQKRIENVFTKLIGQAQGPMTLNIIDSSALKDHDYIIAFREEEFTSVLVYDIFDVHDNIIKVSGAYQLTGAEGELFDGIRLSMFNYGFIQPWKTEWTEVTGDTSTYEIEYLQHRSGTSRSPENYELRFLGENASQSSTGVPLPFQIWNAAEDYQVALIFVRGENGEWVSGESIIFLDSEDSRRTTISLIISWGETDLPPEIGDILTLFYGSPRAAGDQVGFNLQGDFVSVDKNHPFFVPREFDLSQNYPNPFNPLTRIEYSLPVSSEVLLVIYNLRGQEVARILNERQTEGVHTIAWDASKYASGIYFYRLTAGDFVQTRKMLLLK